MMERATILAERAIILVAEDDADVLRAARVALTPCAQVVKTTPDIAELEQILTSARFDVVLLDMNFVSGDRSGSDGLDALDRVRAFDPSLAVMLMTAYGGVALAVRALKRGAVDFILKPWDNDKLINAVTAAVRITRERRAADMLGLGELERGAIQRALSRHDGNISLAAASLGLSRPALYRRMAKHGI